MQKNLFKFFGGIIEKKALEENHSWGIERKTTDEDYVGKYNADGVTVDQDTIDKVITGETPEYATVTDETSGTSISQEMLKKEHAASQVTNITNIDKAEIPVGESTYGTLKMKVELRYVLPYEAQLV